MNAPTQAPANTVVLREVTILYPHLFKAVVPKGSLPGTTPKFSLTVLLPADYDMGPLQQLALTAARSMFGADADKQIMAGAIKSPFRDQAAKAAQGKDGFSGSGKYISLASEWQPGVVDQALQPVLDPSLVYGGKVCNVQVSAFPWNHPTGGRGVSFSLQNIQLVRDGKRIGSGNPDPKSVFEPLAMPAEGAKVDANVRAIFG